MADRIPATKDAVRPKRGASARPPANGRAGDEGARGGAATPKSARTLAKTKTGAKARARANGGSAGGGLTPTPKRLPVVAEPARGQVPCLACGLCCTYVAIDIDAPTCMTDAAQILWYLYHERVSVYFDGEEGWTLQFDSRCNHLQPDNKCAIYEQRPPICRKYSEVGCEVNADDEGMTFTLADEFLAWLEQKRPRIHRKLAERFVPDADHLRGTARNPRALPPFVPTFKKLRAHGVALGARRA